MTVYGLRWPWHLDTTSSIPKQSSTQATVSLTVRPLPLGARSQEERARVPLAAHLVVQRAVVEAVDKGIVLHCELGATQDSLWRRRALAHGVASAATAVAHHDHRTEAQDVALRGHLLDLVDVDDLAQQTEAAQIELVVVVLVGERHVLGLFVHVTQILQQVGIRDLVVLHREAVLLELLEQAAAHLAAVLRRDGLEAALARGVRHGLAPWHDILVVKVVEDRVVELAFFLGGHVELVRRERRRLELSRRREERTLARGHGGRAGHEALEHSCWC